MTSHRNLILFSDEHWFNLLPLTFTRPVCELRVGIMTLKEKWKYYLKGTCSDITQDYLSNKYPVRIEEDNLLINSTFLPNPSLLSHIESMNLMDALFFDDELVAARVDRSTLEVLQATGEGFSDLRNIILNEDAIFDLRRITMPHHIFIENGKEIIRDFDIITKDKESHPISPTNTILGTHPIFVEEGVWMESCILNATDGPIYIGKEAVIMENSVLRGPVSVGEHAVVKVGAKIYKDTTIGPNCKVGGEVQNTVFLANSNKGHDGYIGNSVIGEWCNLGADTNTSNLKNNYLPVKVWSYTKKSFVNTGEQFCGLIMGDHSKSGINTMFNTGTVVGVACNIFGDGFPRTFIPSFSWGGAAGFTTHQLEKALETADVVMKRRGISLTEYDREILTHLSKTDY